MAYASGKEDVLNQPLYSCDRLLGPNHLKLV